jgi:hypothetical protein
MNGNHNFLRNENINLLMIFSVGFLLLSFYFSVVLPLGKLMIIFGNLYICKYDEKRKLLQGLVQFGCSLCQGLKSIGNTGTAFPGRQTFGRKEGAQEKPGR